jgi:hypothetical protein
MTGATKLKEASTPVTYKIKRKLVKPLLKLTVGDTVHIKITSAIFEGKPIKGKEEAKKPAELVNGVDLDTGEEVQMIIPAVVKSVLSEEYPADAYVGKAFAITKGEKKDGKAYFPYSIDEIDA